MLKYNELTLEDGLRIGISYDYTEPFYPNDIDLPIEHAYIEINDVILLEGKLLNLLAYMSYSDAIDYLEGKLYELND